MHIRFSCRCERCSDRCSICNDVSTAGRAALVSLKEDAARGIEQHEHTARPVQLCCADVEGRSRRRAPTSSWACGGLRLIDLQC